MNSTDLKRHTTGAEEALSSFLEMLLGTQTAFKVAPPEAVTRAEAKLHKMAYLVLLGSGFAVLLEPPWLPLVSKAMLGEAMEVGDEGADDLARELAGQGYGAVRNQLGASGVTLPEASFEVYTHGNQLPEEALQNDLWKVAFTARSGEMSLGGVAFLPVTAEATPPTRPAAAPAQPPEPFAASASVAVAPAAFPELGHEDFGGDGDNFSLLAEVELEVTVELGRRKLPLADVLRLTTGSVIELENLVGEPLEVYANGRLIAEGEAVVIDEQFGIRITRLASDRQRSKAFL